MSATHPSSEAFEHGLSPKRLWLLIITIAAMSAFAPLATDVYLPAFPQLTSEFQATDAAAQLTLTASFLGIMIGQLVFGPMSDSFGRRRLVLITSIVTIFATLACAFAPSMGFLIGSRLVLGILGGGGIVIGRAVAADIVKGPEAARFFSVLMSITMIAPLVGPIVGGVLLDLTDTWRSSFFFLAVFCALIVVGIALFIPETLPKERRHTGGLGELGRGAVAMMRDRIFLGYAVTQIFAFGALFAYLASSSFLFQEKFGMSPTMYSFTFSGIAIAIIAVGFWNRNAVLTRSVRGILMWSLGLSALGSIILIPIMASSSPSLWVIIPILLVVIGTRATIGANAMALALERALYVGTASAILGALTFGGAIVDAPLLAWLPFDTGVTMAVVMAICSVLAFASSAFLAREKSA
ncbi:MAG: multidrug effflux MFS transporter [Candidatus Nanopelagicales bacterium]|nr:multidrug effflux MFS transporter [Candidatus Nanopelagicales bacterium]